LRRKNPPQSIREEVNKVTGKDIKDLTRQTKAPEKGPLFMSVQEGYSPCVIGFSIEAALSRPVDIERLEGFGHILGSKVGIDESGQWLTINNMTVYREGSIISKANVENDARMNIDKLFELIIRSEQCVGCSLCVARCEQKALYMKDGRVEIDADECIRCQECLGPCPAVNFRQTDSEL
jgi:phosphoadenosine phosphosulfate reductase